MDIISNHFDILCFHRVWAYLSLVKCPPLSSPVLLLVGLSTAGQALGAPVQVYGITAIFYIAIMTGAVFLTNEFLSSIISSSREVCHGTPSMSL